MPTFNRNSRSEFVNVRGLRYHVRIWDGDDADRPLILLHGGRDASCTFQFLVEALNERCSIIAPDWRGHGLSEWCTHGYYFQDYLADLDRLAEIYSPQEPLRLVGHSLGGNIACLYAGIRTSRVSHVVSLDGFGIPDGDPGRWPHSVASWLDGWCDPPRSKEYATLETLTNRLVAANPRLCTDSARYLAEHLSTKTENGRYRWLFDPKHRIPFPTIHRFSEWRACFERVEAQVLLMMSERTQPQAIAAMPGEIERRSRLFKHARLIQIPGTGHNLHHDAPDTVADHLSEFFLS
jgi:pimeloyl-ACP methyl ester carboxylesterase